MGRKHQSFKSRFSPVVVPKRARALTWPRARTDGGARTPLRAPLAPQASGEVPCAPVSPASVATCGCIRVPDALWCIDQAQSIGDEEESGESVGSSDGESATEEGTTKGRRRRRRGRRGRVWQPPAAPNTSSNRPCNHNSWDNVRVKKDKTTLRCRVCQLQWKVDHAELIGGAKCPDFGAHSRCPRGKQCNLIHIHRFKLNLSKRKAIWGENLLMARRVSDLDNDDGSSPSEATEGAAPKDEQGFAPSPSDNLGWSPRTEVPPPLPTPPTSNVHITYPTCGSRRASTTSGLNVRDAPPTLLLGDASSTLESHAYPLATPQLRGSPPNRFRRPSDTSTLSGAGGPGVRRYSYQPYDFQQQPQEMLQASPLQQVISPPQGHQQPRLVRVTAPPPIHISQRSATTTTHSPASSSLRSAADLNLAAQASGVSLGAYGWSNSPRMALAPSPGVPCGRVNLQPSPSTPSIPSVWTPGNSTVRAESIAAQFVAIHPDRRQSTGSVSSVGTHQGPIAAASFQGMPALAPQAYQAARPLYLQPHQPQPQGFLPGVEASAANAAVPAAVMASGQLQALPSASLPAMSSNVSLHEVARQPMSAAAWN